MIVRNISTKKLHLSSNKRLYLQFYLQAASIFGPNSGVACRREELGNMKIHNIHDTGSYINRLPHTKTEVSRSFVVEGRGHDIVKKCVTIRPKDVLISCKFLTWEVHKLLDSINLVTCHVKSLNIRSSRIRNNSQDISFADHRRLSWLTLKPISQH